MKRIASLVCVLLALAVLPAGITRADETLSNSSIIDLQKLGLGDAVIIQKIKTSHCNFDTSTDGLKELKGAGVSDAVIAAMIGAGSPAPAAGAPPSPPGDPNDPLSVHDSGIYLYENQGGQNKMTQVEPSVFTKTKSNFAFFAMYGEKTKEKAVLDGAHARIQTTTGSPVFYFYFDKTSASLSSGDNETTSPEEFTLAQMEVRESKDERRVTIGKFGVYDGAKLGVDEKEARPLDYEKISPGVYKVTPRGGLSDGEYCFVYTGGGAAPGLGYGAMASGKAFCFGISGGGGSKKK